MIGLLMTAGGFAMGFSQGSMEIQTAQAAAMNGDFDPATIMTMLSSINWLEIFVNFIIYFIGGYVLYASIFAVIGSSVDNEQDTQQFMTPSPSCCYCILCRILQRNNPDGRWHFGAHYPFTTYRNEVRIRFAYRYGRICLHRIFYGSFAHFDVGSKISEAS
jgi:ABC-2 type transport system permease protein